MPVDPRPEPSGLPRIGPTLRTPDAAFEGLVDFPWAPRYTDLDGLRVAHLDEGPAEGSVVLLMHGEPTWSYLYRKVIAALRDRYRVVTPDLVGFGRSDKLPRRANDRVDQRADVSQRSMLARSFGSRPSAAAI